MNNDWYIDIVPGGHISSKYGRRKAPITGASSFHNGVDISAPLGTRIYSPIDGQVLYRGQSDTAGWMIVVANDEMEVHVYHMQYGSDCGEVVNRGDVIGLVGSTGISSGPHAHIGVKVDGRWIDPATVEFTGD